MFSITTAVYMVLNIVIGAIVVQNHRSVEMKTLEEICKLVAFVGGIFALAIGQYPLATTCFVMVIAMRAIE